MFLEFVSSKCLHTVTAGEETSSFSRFNSPQILWLLGKEDWYLIISIPKLLGISDVFKMIRVMRICELSNWTLGSNISQTPHDPLYLNWCLGQWSLFLSLSLLNIRLRMFFTLPWDFFQIIDV